MAKYRNDSLGSISGLALALTDTGRLRILHALVTGELCVCQVTELLGLAPSTVSKHLSVLKQAGLIAARKDGRWIYYRLADCPSASLERQALDWALAGHRQDEQLAHDRKRLAEIRQLDLEVLCCRTKC